MATETSCYKCRNHGNGYCFMLKQSLFGISYTESEKIADKCENYSSRY